MNGEYVTIRNTTRRAIDLAGWTLRDKTGYTYTFGDDVLLGAGKKLTLHPQRLRAARRLLLLQQHPGRLDQLGVDPPLTCRNAPPVRRSAGRRPLTATR
nr:lamin tail domain-containing protein [Streptosporangium roseum]